MLVKISIAVLTTLVVLTFSWYFGLTSARSGVGVLPGAETFTTPCHADIGPHFIQKLSFDTPEATQAALKLLELAKESSGCRDAVIREVLAALNKADLENDDSAFRLWAKGSAILGDLKAVEAIDVLAAHLDLSDGLFSASMVHEPVVLAMIKMGEVAVPKLSVVLKHSPDKRMRLAAAYCLGDIGGPQAEDAMKTALNSETTECVRRYIMLTLPNPDETTNSKRRLTPADGELLRQRILAYRCGD